MLRRWIIGAPVVVGLLALGFATTLSPSFRLCESNYETHEGDYKRAEFEQSLPWSSRVYALPWVLTCEGAFIDQNGATIAAFATLAIAWFTLTLKRSTDNLWRTTIRQARLAERAYTELERPYTYVEFPHSGFHIDGDGITPRGSLVLRCVNHGRTPCDITQLEYVPVWLKRGEFPEPFPLAEFGRTRPPGTVAGPSGGYFEEPTNMWGMFSQDQLEEFFHERGSIFVTGYVRYADAFGAHHITGFNAALDHLSGRFVLRGDERYNYTRTERERPER